MNTVIAMDVPRPGRSLWSRGWEHLSVYLPVVLMMFLALGSYLLLQATPEPPKPPPERAPTHDADYFMRRFSVKVFGPEGTLASEMYGTEAQHYPDTDTVEVENARVRAFNQYKQLSTATARQIVANGEGTQFELKGDAVVVRQAGRTNTGRRVSRMEFHGQYLQVSTKPEHVSSNQPVLLIRDNDQITADALDYKGDKTLVVVLTGRVRAKLVSNLR